MANNNGTSDPMHNDDQHPGYRPHDRDVDPRHRDDDRSRDPHSTERYGQGQSGYMAGRRDDRGVDTFGRNRMHPYDRDDARSMSGGDRNDRDQQQRVWDSSRRDYAVRSHPSDGSHGYGFDDSDRSGYNDRGYSDRGYGGQGYANQGFGSEGAANQGQFGTDYANRGYNYPRHDAPAKQGGHRGKLPMNFAYSDEKLRERICEMLGDHDLVDPSNVDVKVKTGEVTITGTISDRHQKRMIAEMVEDIPGVQDVHMSVKLDHSRS